MVWTPDALVTQYMTRDTEPDASNRARHHCNACLQIFPLGSVREMRDHLFKCPSLGSNTISRIRRQIQAEEATPKTTIRDPRWTSGEEQTLLKMDGELSDSKNSQRYVKMAIALPGRSAQACRQKLLHLKQAEKGRREREDENHEARLNVKTRSQRTKEEQDEEDDDNNEGDEEDFGESTNEEEFTGSSLANAEDSGAKKSHVGINFRIQPRKGLAAAIAAEEFVRLTRWALHEVFSKCSITKTFYTSPCSLHEGWNVFLKSKIPSKDKNKIVEKIYAQWLNGADIPSFDRAVNVHMDSIIQDLANWDPEFAVVKPEYVLEEEDETENEENEGSLVSPRGDDVEDADDDDGEVEELGNIDDDDEEDEEEEAEEDDDDDDDGSEYEDSAGQRW